jgi:DNA-binding IclR family transcriptional regulator
MSPEPLPSEIAAFIGEHLLTTDEIEALTAMCDAPARWWDARLMCRELGLPLSTARLILDHLAALNLLDIRLSDEVRYRLQPGTPELNEMVCRLVSAYRTNRAAVVRAIARVAKRSVLDFADAFRLRKNDGDR